MSSWPQNNQEFAFKEIDQFYNMHVPFVSGFKDEIDKTPKPGLNAIFHHMIGYAWQPILLVEDEPDKIPERTTDPQEATVQQRSISKMFSIEDNEGEKKPRKRACDGLRTRLKECLILSDCVQKGGKTPKECLNLKDDPSVPHECHLLRTAFYDCKRSLIDMRARFRGRKGD